MHDNSLSYQHAYGYFEVLTRVSRGRLPSVFLLGIVGTARLVCGARVRSSLSPARASVARPYLVSAMVVIYCHWSLSDEVSSFSKSTSPRFKVRFSY